MIKGGRNFDSVEGGPGDDIIKTFGDIDFFLDGPGDDVVHAGSGPDETTNQEGDDVVHLGSGRDQVFTDGPGNDIYRGGEDRQPLDWRQWANRSRSVRRRAGRDLIMSQSFGRPLVIDLMTGVMQEGGLVEDRVNSIEQVHGTPDGDTLIGNAANNVLLGFAGDDHIEGRDGDDVLFGSDGIDSLDGGNGTDTCVGETVLNCEA